MDDRVRKLKTPAECEIFAKNAKAKGFEVLALQAKRRAIELRAEAYGATSDAERECIQAIYAYEEILRNKHGKRVGASRTWGAVRRKGIIAAVEGFVDRTNATAGFNALEEIGLDNFAFEAVVLRHPSLFSESAVARSRARLDSLADG